MAATAAFLFASLFLLGAGSASAAIRYYEFNVSYITIAPDCVTKTIVAVNGQYPGPDVTGTLGDTFLIKTCNNVPDQQVSLHWHGLHQRNTQWYDGPAFGTQCPLDPGECFTYNFTTGPQFGTFWWHGHVSLLRASVYGALIIYPPPGYVEPFPKPDGDQVFLLNDWYHRSNDDIIAGLHNSTSWMFIGEPDSLLINGRGRQDCSQYTCPEQDYVPGPCGKCNQYDPGCNPLTTFIVKRGFTYRLRFINVALWGQLNVQIENHVMTVVEIDGSYVKPYKVTSLTTAPAEVFSVLVKFNQPPRDYWLVTNGQYDNVGVPPGLAVVHYAGICGPDGCSRAPVPHSPIPTGPDFKNLGFGPYQQLGFKSLKVVPGLATRKVDRHVVLQWNMHQQVDGTIRYSVNNFSHEHGNTPLLASQYFGFQGVFSEANSLQQLPKPLNGSDHGLYPTNIVVNSVLTVQEGEFVQIVLQNHIPPGGNHPWHLHGHDFYVVGYGIGQYDWHNEWYYNKTYNLVDPPLRNMVTVWENHWIAIRFLANNVGVWNMHCHMEPHFELGMQIFVRVNPTTGALPPPPHDYPKCGRLKQA